MHSKRDANLKESSYRYLMLFKLSWFFFRCNELICNIAHKHIELHSDYIRIFVPRSKTDVRKRILSLLVHPHLRTVLLVFYNVI